LKAAEVAEWVQRLGGMPDVCGWRAGSTWQGRPVWALEAALGGAGKAVSLPRLRLLKPTLLMNARHHANEISSTNAALALVWELGATEWGRAALKRVNVAVVPLENADGAATLEALLPGATDHKLHAARYNALGVEWYGDYFSDAPRFPRPGSNRGSGAAGCRGSSWTRTGFPATSGNSPSQAMRPAVSGLTGYRGRSSTR
jgi:hypothetical protein